MRVITSHVICSPATMSIKKWKSFPAVSADGWRFPSWRLYETNLLLLDEPTNHLDIPSQEILQDVLDNYAGTILLVSHDRYLIDALATQVWEIEPDESQLDVFKGTYSELRARKEATEEQAARESVAVKPTAAKPKRASASASKEERRRVAKLQELENTIAGLDKKLAELERELENPPSDARQVAKLGREYNSVQEGNG